jgi:dTDP-4-dehydrorhamnose reductase
MRVLVTGAGGQLGSDLVIALTGAVPPAGRRRSLLGPEGRGAGVDVTGADRSSLPVEDRTAVLGAVLGVRPDVIVHCGAWTAVDSCEGDPDRAFSVNALGTRHVAEAARIVGAHLVYLSTDYVFDGTATRPYVEWDDPHPLSVYGRSKLGGERECPADATVVRTSWVCGASGANVVKTPRRG